MHVPNLDLLQASYLHIHAQQSMAESHSFPEALDPRLLFLYLEGDLGLDSGIPQSVYRIDTSEMSRIALDSLKPGETFNFSAGSITLKLLYLG
jgi:cytochrome c biogenesis protein